MAAVLDHCRAFWLPAAWSGACSSGSACVFLNHEKGIQLFVFASDPFPQDIEKLCYIGSEPFPVAAKVRAHPAFLEVLYQRVEVAKFILEPDNGSRHACVGALAIPGVEHRIFPQEMDVQKLVEAAQLDEDWREVVRTIASGKLLKMERHIEKHSMLVLHLGKVRHGVLLDLR
jgi:hypothetical protein